MAPEICVYLAPGGSDCATAGELQTLKFVRGIFVLDPHRRILHRRFLIRRLTVSEVLDEDPAYRLALVAWHATPEFSDLKQAHGLHRAPLLVFLGSHGRLR